MKDILQSAIEPYSRITIKWEGTEKEWKGRMEIKYCVVRVDEMRTRRTNMQSEPILMLLWCSCTVPMMMVQDSYSSS